MKKKLAILLSAITAFSICSCKQNTSTSSSSLNTSSEITSSVQTLPLDNVESLPKVQEDVGFAIHYVRKDQRYTSWNLWLWEVGGDGADYSFTGIDSYGAVARYTFEEFSKTSINNGIGFIVKEAKTWAEGASKDVDSDRFMDFSNLTRDEYGYYNIYLKQEDKGVYVDDKGQLLDVIQYFDIAYNKVTGYLIWFQTNHDFAEFKIYQGEDVLADHNTDDGNVERKTTKRFQYYLTSLPDLASDIVLDVKFKDSGKVLTKTVSKSALYGTKIFEDTYSYEGDLGALFTDESTEFKVWSPISSEIKLRIYDNGTPESVDPINGDDTYAEHEMIKGEKGVWSVEVEGDLGGKYYTYVVTNYSELSRAIKNTSVKYLTTIIVKGTIVLDYDITIKGSVKFLGEENAELVFEKDNSKRRIYNSKNSLITFENIKITRTVTGETETFPLTFNESGSAWFINVEFNVSVPQTGANQSYDRITYVPNGVDVTLYFDNCVFNTEAYLYRGTMIFYNSNQELPATGGSPTIVDLRNFKIDYSTKTFTIPSRVKVSEYEDFSELLASGATFASNTLYYISNGDVTFTYTTKDLKLQTPTLNSVNIDYKLPSINLNIIDFSRIGFVLTSKYLSFSSSKSEIT